MLLWFTKYIKLLAWASVDDQILFIANQILSHFDRSVSVVEKSHPFLISCNFSTYIRCQLRIKAIIESF